MRYSHQREKILEIVKNSYKHPSAEMVYKEVKKYIPDISLGTVYRNLNQLSDKGLILKIDFPDGSSRFDKTINDHYHIICSKCERVTDISNILFKNLDNNVENDTNYKNVTHNITFIGICPECREKKEG